MDAREHIAEAERLLARADRGGNVNVDRSIQWATAHASVAAALNTLPVTYPNLVDALGGEWFWVAGYCDGDGNMMSREAIESDPELYPVTEVEA